MIISKTPFRISLVGGGSDLKSFYKDSPGAVVSTTIDKYIYFSINHEGKKRKIYKLFFLGFLNSLFNRKSSYRAEID